MDSRVPPPRPASPSSTSTTTSTTTSTFFTPFSSSSYTPLTPSTSFFLSSPTSTPTPTSLAPIFTATVDGDTSALADLLALPSTDVNAVSLGITPVEYAIVHGHLDVFQLLVRAGAELSTGPTATSTQATSSALDAAKDSIVHFAFTCHASDELLRGVLGELAARGVAEQCVDKEGLSPLLTLLTNTVSWSAMTQPSVRTQPTSQALFAMPAGVPPATVVNSEVRERVRGLLPVFVELAPGGLFLEGRTKKHTVLSKLIEMGWVEEAHLMLDLLDEAGVDVAQFPTSSAALVLAMGEGVTYAFKASSRYSSDVDRVCPVPYSTGKPIESLVLKLLRLGVAPDTLSLGFGRAPLHIACALGKLDLIRALVDAGARVDQPTPEGATCVHAAVVGRNPTEVLRVLPEIPVHDALYGSLLTPLLVLCLRPSLTPEPVKILLEAGADVSAADSSGNTCLHLLTLNCSPSRIDVAPVLLDAGACPDTKNATGHTPLSLLVASLDTSVADAARLGGFLAEHSKPDPDAMAEAIRGGHFDVVWYMLVNGFDANARDSKWQQAPLTHMAGALFNISAVRNLLEHGADVNAVDLHGRSPLHQFIQSSAMPDVIELLREFGADATIAAHDGTTPLHVAKDAQITAVAAFPGVGVNAQDAEGRTPALHAAQNTHSASTLVALCQLGADLNIPDHHGSTPLLVCLRRNMFSIEVLLDHGADVTIADENGETPLLLAAKTAPALCLRILGMGADPLCKHARTQRGCLHYLAEGSTSSMGLADSDRERFASELLDALLARGVGIEDRDADGNTPLHLFANVSWYGLSYSPLVPKLLDRGASLDAQNNAGKTPLMVCCTSDLSSFVGRFDPGVANNDGDTLLHLVLRRSSRSCECVMRASSVETLNHVNKAGDAPLHIALQHGLSAVPKLLELGASVHVPEQGGQRMMQLAMRSASPTDMITALVRHGADPKACMENGTPVLHYAITLQAYKLALFLYNSGASPLERTTSAEGLAEELPAGLNAVELLERIDARELLPNADAIALRERFESVNAFVTVLAPIMGTLDAPEQQHSSLHRFSKHALFALDCVCEIFTLVDGRPHRVDRAARAARHAKP